MAQAIDGKRIILTGASSGIGRAAAIQLAELGAEMHLVARREEELQSAQQEIEAIGGTAHIYPTDLTDLAGLDALVDGILEEHGKVDVLVNNAGRSIRRPVVKALDRFHDYERCMQINYYAPLRLIMKVLPGMLEAGDGHIVNVLTWGTLLPAANFTAYNASKCALGAAAQGMDAELRSKGVPFTSVHYPLVHTAMSAPTDHYNKMPGMTPEQAGKWIVKAVRKRPARIAPSYAVAAGVNNTLFPGLSAAVAGRLKF